MPPGVDTLLAPIDDAETLERMRFRSDELSGPLKQQPGVQPGEKAEVVLPPTSEHGQRQISVGSFDTPGKKTVHTSRGLATVTVTPRAGSNGRVEPQGSRAENRETETTNNTMPTNNTDTDMMDSLPNIPMTVLGATALLAGVIIWD